LTIYKDSIHPAINTELDQWLDERAHLDTFIAVGDVTDLCVYQLATYLKLHANAHQMERRVIVPEDCVQTWHLSVEAAESLPAMPHHGDMLHATFLYHMALNAIEVVKRSRPINHHQTGLDIFRGLVLAACHPLMGFVV
jgi:nicotinamidase-related amidase